MSRRTDGGPAQPARYMAGGDYGDGQEMMSLQEAAPMAATRTPQTQGQRVASQPGAVAAPPTPLFAPTERPDEPVTEGSAVGPGNGPAVLSGGVGSVGGANRMDAQQLQQYLPSLMRTANQPNVPASFVRFVHYLRSM